MQDYLYEFTERVVKGTRSGDLEKQQIAAELTQLLSEKPEDASEEMEIYLRFLLALTKGESYDDLWNKLPDNMKELFGNTIQKFKGNDIDSFLEDLTDKVINTIKEGDETKKEAVLSELDNLIKDKPDGGSETVLKYIIFLKKLLQNESPDEEYTALDQNLKTIYDNRIQITVQNDMMDFMNRITSLAFQAKKDDSMRPQAKEQLESLLNGPQQPPEEIKIYINALIEVSQGNYLPSMADNMAMELKEIFNHHGAQ
jgi:hypothetical protein